METVYYINQAQSLHSRSIQSNKKGRDINKHPNRFARLEHVDKQQRKKGSQAKLSKQRSRNYPKTWVKDIPEKDAILIFIYK